MARQRPTRLVMGPCIAEIDRIVIREVHHQLEVNWCRNEEVIVKGNFGWIDGIVIREVQYQFEVNRCRNEEIIVKAILGGCGLVMGPCIVEIDPNVIREVQYQFEVNPCRNEKIIVNGIFLVGVAYVGGRPRIDPNVITKVQYQFEVNPCRNEKIIVNGNFGGCGLCGRGAPGLGMGPCMVEIDRIVIREFQGSSAFSVGGDSGQDGRTDRQTDGRTDGRRR
ncbi:hypothetical protein DPMN_000977 [Dreissena polymorpha]|uniref:Uncharacterized protein n=1 Tax=Dreissena polymorpha TaxID=45954 RepID=A0A9D4MJ70_DREPO|nr:hypothetical protein DPMN_000977 [Dreissena polymorpha]